jgi:hypothetical protein
VKTRFPNSHESGVAERTTATYSDVGIPFIHPNAHSESEDHLRRTLSALFAAAVTAAAVCVPAAADATTAPTVQFAFSVDGDLGRIEVGVLAEAGVGSIVVHVVSPTTGADVAVVTAFHLVSGDPTSGLWESDNEVILPDLGFYPLNVEVTDNAGVHVEADSIGHLNYAVQMSFTDLSSTKSVTYTDRSFAVAGTLTGLWPGTRTTATIAGFPVEMVTQYGDIEDGTTDARGQFALTAQVENVDDTAYVTTLYDPSRLNYLQAYTNVPAPTITPAASRITINVDRNSIVSGDPITVSGDASWKSPDGWVPIANTPIAVGVCPPGQDQSPGSCFNGPNTTSDANGHYSIVLTPYLGDLVMAGVSLGDPFVEDPAFATAKVTVLAPASFASFTAVRDTDTGLVFVGSQGLLLPVLSTADTQVTVQFSKNGVTSWHTVATIDDPGGQFGEEYPQPDAGYWRIVYAGVKGLIESAQTDAVFVE